MRKVPERHRLTTERTGLVHRFVVAGHEGYIRTGEYPDGALGEVFIRMSKSGSTLSGLMDGLASVVSIALQHGVPLSVISAKLVDSRFEPAGFTGNPDIPAATSVLDYVFRWLDLQYEKPRTQKVAAPREDAALHAPVSSDGKETARNTADDALREEHVA